MCVSMKGHCRRSILRPKIEPMQCHTTPPDMARLLDGYPYVTVGVSNEKPIADALVPTTARTLTDRRGPSELSIVGGCAFVSEFTAHRIDVWLIQRVELQKVAPRYAVGDESTIQKFSPRMVKDVPPEVGAFGSSSIV